MRAAAAAMMPPVLTLCLPFIDSYAIFTCRGALRRSKPPAATQPDIPQLRASASMPERSTTASRSPQVRRASASAALPDNIPAAPRLEVMLKSKIVGQLLTPIAAAASAGRRPAGSSCHLPAAGSPSGMCVTSTSWPSSSRSRNDV